MLKSEDWDWMSLSSPKWQEVTPPPDPLSRGEKLCLARVRAGDASAAWLAADGLNPGEVESLLWRARVKLNARTVQGAVVAAIWHRALDSH